MKLITHQILLYFFVLIINCDSKPISNRKFSIILFRPEIQSNHKNNIINELFNSHHLNSKITKRSIRDQFQNHQLQDKPDKINNDNNNNSSISDLVGSNSFGYGYGFYGGYYPSYGYGGGYGNGWGSNWNGGYWSGGWNSPWSSLYSPYSGYGWF